MKPDLKKLPSEWLEQIINLSYEYIVIVDREGKILYMSRPYCEFIKKTCDEVIGHPVQDVIENTRMHIVVKTGEKEVEHMQPIQGSVMIANRYPIIINGEIVGGLGNVMFPNPDYLRDFNNKIQDLIEDLDSYKTRAGHELSSKYSFDDLTGESSSFKAVKELGKKVAGSDSSVLITGESGTGKELFAHAIHHHSLRSRQTFVPINCASIPEVLFESELFGHVEGAFTGARKGGKDGLFKAADKGTVFLDEIGEMPLSMQSKLLRTLQEKEIQPVGSEQTIPVDVRIICATNQNLLKMVEEGTFREDLYYRINVIHIEVPPLRERKEDLPLISKDLLAKLEQKFYRNGTILSDEAAEKLQQHNWPGNVRELENVLERAINVLDGYTVKTEHLPLYISDLPAPHSAHTEPVKADPEEEPDFKAKPLKEIVEDAEKEALSMALKAAEGNKLEAARLLKIGKTSFYDKCRQYGIR